jgi:AAA ATPase domain
MNKANNDKNFAESRIFSKQSNTMLFEFKKVGIQKLLYIPTERFLISTISESLFSLINNKVTIPKFILEFGELFITARDKIGLFNISYLDINYRFKNGRDIISNSKLDYEIELSSSASGIQAIIPLKLVVEYNALFDDEFNKHFIIEEPELNLFPTTQKQLIGYLSDRCTKGNNELLMTTHSPYVLSALNNLIFAYKVANEVPERAEEVAQIIPREQWLNPEDFAAYYVADGGIRSIVNPKTGLISENELDSVSEDIGGEFDELMSIYRQRNKTYAATN